MTTVPKKDGEIDQLVKGADPYDARGIDLLGADQALLEEIMGTTRPHTFRNRLLGAVAVAAALTAAIGIPAALDERDREGRQQVTPPSQTTEIRYTAAVIEAAKRNPRLLITAPGWQVVDVVGFTTDEGGLTYEKGGDQWLKLFWQPVSHYADFTSKRDAEYRSLQVPGLGGQIIVYDLEGDSYEAVVPGRAGDAAFARIKVDGRAEMEAVLASLQRADVETWLAALPDEVVTPADTTQAVDKVLDGVPLPPGFDRSALTDLGTNTEYHLAVPVIDRVLCGWVASWENGDQAAKEAAVQAVGSSRTWPILVRMNAEGDYPEFVWDLADRMAAGDVPVGVVESLNCG